MQEGKELGLHPGHTSTIRRIEGGMLSYHSDMDINTNPLELGLDKFIDLDGTFDFVGKDALIEIKKSGIQRKQVGLIIECEKLKGPNTKKWDIYKNQQYVGQVTSAVYSPRLQKNIALAIVDIEYSDIDTSLKIKIDDEMVDAIITKKPFFDPNKLIAKKSTI
jgi:aminomethyltransferase